MFYIHHTTLQTGPDCTEAGVGGLGPAVPALLVVGIPMAPALWSLRSRRHFAGHKMPFTMLLLAGIMRR